MYFPQCYLESVISELGGPLSSLRQLPQDLDPHNNECDEQTVSDRNTLLYFSELGKTHSSTDRSGIIFISLFFMLLLPMYLACNYVILFI